MKICYIDSIGKEYSPTYVPMLEKAIEMVRRPDTEIGYKTVTPGLDWVKEVTCTYFHLLWTKGIVEKAIEAEKDGYDAAVIGCFFDPGLQQAREVVDIPVIGVAEASMLVACLMGRNFGIVTLTEPKLHPGFEAAIRALGLQERTAPNPVRGISMSMADLYGKGMKNPKLIADAVMEKARELVADGAEVIIVGNTAMSPPCTVSGLTKLGDAVPILDCVSVGIKAAEMIVDLRSKFDLPAVSRAGIYGMADRKTVDKVRARFGLK